MSFVGHRRAAGNQCLRQITSHHLLPQLLTVFDHVFAHSLVASCAGGLLINGVCEAAVLHKVSPDMFDAVKGSSAEFIQP